MISNVWEFYVPPEHVERFEALNGKNGEWAKFFGESPGHRGTNLLKRNRLIELKSGKIVKYVSYDRWDSKEAFGKHILEDIPRYLELDHENRGLVKTAHHLGLLEFVED